jgi:hypothetical protein
MEKETIDPHLMGDRLDGEEEARLASDFPATCRIGHLMF